MKKYIKIAFPVLFLFLVVNSCFSVKMIRDVSEYGKLINYVGIVRGASQRLIKLELSGEQNDDLAGYVEGILEELRTGKGEYGLVRTKSEEYNANLERLDKQWQLVLSEIPNVRSGGSKDRLLEDSEELFTIANETVFSLEAYSSMRTSEL